MLEVITPYAPLISAGIRFYQCRSSLYQHSVHHEENQKGEG